MNKIINKDITKTISEKQYIEHDPRVKYFREDQIELIDELIPIMEKENLIKEANRFCNCGRKLIIMTCDNQRYHGIKRFAFPYYCELRICHRCSRKRASVVKKQIEGIIKYIPKTRTHKFALLTLTQNMSDNLELTPEKLRNFNSNVRKLINGMFPKKKNCGAISVLEIGRNFNIHAHIFIYGHYVPQKLISENWKKITKDSYIVDIRAVRDYKVVYQYLLKYIAKPPLFYELEHYVAFLNALKGVRRLHRFGIMYGFKVILKKDPLKCPYCGSGLMFLIECFNVENIKYIEDYWEVKNLIDKGENVS